MMTCARSIRLTAAGAAFLCACQGDAPLAPEPLPEPDVATPPVTPPPPPAARGASMFVVAEPDSVAGTITYVVRMRPNDAVVSSFQGAVSFDASAYELVSHATPSQPGRMFIVNTSIFGAGSIRFAAFTPSTFGADTMGVETFRFTVRQLSEATAPVAALDVVGTAAGASVVMNGNAAAMIGAQTCEAGLWGDVNADEMVNIADAQQIARFGAGLSVANSDAVNERGDVTADGSVNIVDAQQIARFGVGLSATPRVNSSLCS